jgi:hypothetical protein
LLLATLRLRRTLLLLLLRRPIRPWPALLLRLPRPRPALLLRLLRLLVAILAHLLARALFELADFFLHVPLRLAHLLDAQLVVPAVRATLPSLGIGLLARRAKDAFWQRHREIGAHCTLRAVDDSRRRTLEALLELAGDSSPSACWDDQRAVELLRRQATEDELRALGADEGLLAHIYPEGHDG